MTIERPTTPKEYIASGDFYIAANEPKILKALLGSCVGVALYDKTAQVGGLCHLLLPEPASADSAWSPKSFATTGLPLFIKELLKAGAERGRLQAVIAGGALFGRVSQHDINLNIGGRCIDKVLNILHHEKIKIIQEETGGFHPSAIELNTTHWQTKITPTFAEGSAPTPSLSHPSPDDIEEEINLISPIPQAALKVIHLIDNNDYNMGAVADALKADQVLVAKILSLCNSAMVGAKRQVNSLDEALLILGESHLVEIVISAAVDSFFEQQKGGYSLLRGGLYKHALGTAHCAKAIARSCRREEAGVAYTAGLLHDIGKIVLDRHFAALRPLFYKNQYYEGDTDLIEREGKLLGTNHQEVGARLAEKWCIPSKLFNVIKYHHQPEWANQGRELVYIVHLGDLLSTWFLAGMEYEQINTDALQIRLDFLGIKADQLPGIIAAVPWNKLMYV